jgi:hypothetical protein
MLAGVVLIGAGVLIAMYPPLLAWIVAILLIVVGVFTWASAYYHKRLARRSDNPVVELIMRF